MSCCSAYALVGYSTTNQMPERSRWFGSLMNNIPPAKCIWVFFCYLMHMLHAHRVIDGRSVLAYADDDVFYLFLGRNQKQEPSSIYTLRKVRTVRGCLEGLALMIWRSRMVLASPGPLLTPLPSSSPPKTPIRCVICYIHANHMPTAPNLRERLVSLA